MATKRFNTDGQIKTLRCQDMVIVNKECDLRTPEATINTAYINHLVVGSSSGGGPSMGTVDINNITELDTGNAFVLSKPIFSEPYGLGRLRFVADGGPIFFATTLGEPLVLDQSMWTLTFESTSDQPALLPQDTGLSDYLFRLPETFTNLCLPEQWEAYVEVSVVLYISNEMFLFDLYTIPHTYQIIINNNTSIFPISCSNHHTPFRSSPLIPTYEVFSIQLRDTIRMLPGEALSISVVFNMDSASPQRPILLPNTHPITVSGLDVAADGHATFRIVSFSNLSSG